MARTSDESFASGGGRHCAGNSLASGRGRRCKGNSLASGGGRRYKGFAFAAWFRVLLQHAGAARPCAARTRTPCSDVLRDRGVLCFGEACRGRLQRSHGPSGGERRGSAGIGRKQAMDGLRSPVGAMDGGIRRCARSPHCRGSPPKPADSVASKPGRIRHPTFGEEPFRVPVRPAGGGRRSSWRGAGRHRANRPVRPAGRCPRARNRRAGPVAGGRGRADPGPGHR